MNSFRFLFLIGIIMKSTFSSFAQNKITISEEMWTLPTYKVKPAAKQLTTNCNQLSTCEALYLQGITLKALELFDYAIDTLLWTT